MDGFLPQQLVSYNILDDSLKHINSQLRQISPKFSVAETNPAAYYYIQNSIAFTQTEDSLIISLRVPIQQLNFDFEIYKLFSIPVPLNGSTTNSSIISDLPHYLAVSDQANYYVELEYEFVSTCKGQNILLCTAFPVLRTRRLESCALSLYLDRPSDVMRLCRFKYETSLPSQNAISLGDDFYLVSSTTDSTWTMICENDLHPHAIPACSICVIKTKCYCSIQSSSFYMPAKVTGCDAASVKMVHGINLAYLHLFDHEVNTSKITSVTTFSQFPQYTIAPLNIVNFSNPKIVSHRNKFRADFKKIANNVRNSIKTYDSLSDFMLDSTDFPYSFSPSTNFILLSSLLAYMAFSLSSLSPGALS